MEKTSQTSVDESPERDPILLSEFKQLFSDKDAETLCRRIKRKVSNAKSRGLDFNLALEDILMMSDKLLGRGVCDYSGLPFRKHNPADDESIRWSPSLERINDKEGYVRGNCCVVIQRVNQLKDILWDKALKATIHTKDHQFTRSMMEVMTSEHLESLKKAYVPDFTFSRLPAGELLKIPNGTQGNDSLPKQAAAIENPSVIDSKPSEFKDMQTGTPSEKEAQNEPNEAFDTIPEDVAVAEAYAGLVRFLVKSGKKVEISFLQFKSVYKAKKCFITGKELTSDILPVILDVNIPVEKGNLKFAEAKSANALNILCEQSGMSVGQIVKNLNKTFK